MIDIDNDVWVLNEDKVAQTTQDKDSLSKPQSGIFEQVVREDDPQEGKILVLKGDDIIKVDSSPFIIGVGANSDYVIKGDTYVSRRHCRITERNNRFFIEDMNSTNGTFVDGKDIKSKTELLEGMEVILADRIYRVSWQS